MKKAIHWIIENGRAVLRRARAIVFGVLKLAVMFCTPFVLAHWILPMLGLNIGNGQWHGLALLVTALWMTKDSADTLRGALA